jgi:cysteine-rich repeat protein
MHKLSSLSCVAALGLLASCSLGNGEEHTKSLTGNNTGELRVSLLATSAIDIAEVNYSIQVPEHSALQGKLPVGEDGTVSGTVADVPASEGVLVALTAAGANGEVCSGEGTVTVLAGQTTGVSIVLQCRLGDTPVTTGTIEITGTFNVCPQVLDATATPASTESTSAVASNSTDLNMDTLTLAWTATSGSFADAAAASTTYTCASSGEQTLTLTADDGKGCTHSKTVKVTCTAVTPPTPVCGNNTKEGTEECDDGNTTAGDGCSATCTTEVTPPAPVCGNNTKEGTEECDDGNTTAGDGCSATCTTEVTPPAPVCGNGTTEGTEGCDDGNTAAGDGCSATCTVEEEPAGICEAPPNACAECSCTSCATQIAACEGATGNAAAGPGAGQPKAELCAAVVKCGQAAGCRGSVCFCGTATLIECLGGMGNGPCQAEIFAAAETEDPVEVSGRQQDNTFAIGLSNAVSTCSVNSCAAACPAAAPAM